MTIDSNGISRGLENIAAHHSKKEEEKEIATSKGIIYAHCYGILPTLQEASRVFNSNSEFVKFYKALRGENLKLSDLANPGKRNVVKFAYPIRLHEEAKRTEETGDVEIFRLGARLGIDTLTENGFAPSLIFENESGIEIKYYPNDVFIKDRLYKQLRPNVSEVDFLREVVRSLNFWDAYAKSPARDAHNKFDAEYRITKRFVDTFMRLIHSENIS